MFEVFHGVERILQWFGDILLDILCRAPGYIVMTIIEFVSISG